MDRVPHIKIFIVACSAGGWRVGYAIVPKQLEALKTALISAASHTYSCAPAPMQVALEAGLGSCRAQIRDRLKAERAVLKAVRDFVVAELRSVGVRVHPSAGGYYLMPDFEVVRPGLERRGLKLGQDWCDVMLKEAKVAVIRQTSFKS